MEIPKSRASRKHRAFWPAAAVLAAAITATPALVQVNSASITTAHSERTSVRTMQADLGNRSLDIDWPKGFTPADADLFSHNDLLINATCMRVWRHIVEATKWPEWYPNSKSVQILGDEGSVLKDNAVFHWTTFGLALESRINEFVPFSR